MAGNPSGINYNDQWRFLNQLMEAKINEFHVDLKAYLCEIVASDGYYATVKLIKETGLQPFTNIPVLQSKYHSPITMPGDQGLLINLHQNISQILDGKTSADIDPTSFYVFLPLISKADYEGEFNKQRLSSSMLDSFIELSDTGIDIEASQELNTKTKKLTTNSEESITIETKETTLTSTDKLEVTSKEITIKGDSKITLESGGDLTIKSSSPIELGTSQQLGGVLNDICSALASFMTAPVSPGAPAAADPGFITKITTAQSKLAQILKS